MTKDYQFYFDADVASVFNAYHSATVQQNNNIHQSTPPHSLSFGVKFSFKYNMHGGSCSVSFVPCGNGTTVRLTIFIVQLIGARCEAYVKDLSNAAGRIINKYPQQQPYNASLFTSTTPLPISQPAAPVYSAPPVQPAAPMPPMPAAPAAPTYAPPVQPAAPAYNPAPIPPMQPAQPIPPTPPAPAYTAPPVRPNPPAAPAITPPPAAPVDPAPAKAAEDITIICPNCSNTINANSLFCKHCGVQINPKGGLCNRCGAKTSPSSAFCTTCGNKLR